MKDDPITLVKTMEPKDVEREVRRKVRVTFDVDLTDGSQAAFVQAEVKRALKAGLEKVLTDEDAIEVLVLLP